MASLAPLKSATSVTVKLQSFCFTLRKGACFPSNSFWLTPAVACSVVFLPEFIASHTESGRNYCFAPTEVSQSSRLI